VIRVTVDGVVLNGTGVEGAERPQDRIHLVDDRREHYVEVDLS